MLDKIRELSISIWSPVGEFVNSIFGTSNIWFPIVAYMVGSVAILFILKKFLDMTVTKTSSLDVSTIWSLLKKIVLYAIIAGVTLAVIVSLYFYLDKIYHEYQPVEKEQSLDYLLR